MEEYEMPTLMELTSEIVSAHASSTQLSADELLNAIQRVYATLKELEGGAPAEAPAAEEKKAGLSPKQSIKKNEVICLICGKGGMKTLTRHLSQAHEIKPSAYRKQFGIPRTQPLAAKDFTARRKEIASTMDLAANLAKARATRAANLKAKKTAPKKTAKAKK
jgi:predicted transcriptional regulator